MSVLEESPDSPLKKRPPAPRWSDIWLKNTKPLKHVVLAMQLQSLASKDPKSQTLIPHFANIDRTLLLSDELLLTILSKLPLSQRKSNSLVCRRWLNLQGRLVRSLKILDWNFLVSCRFITRFPNLAHVDLLNGCLFLPRNSEILLTHRMVSTQMSSGFCSNLDLLEENLLPVEVVDKGLQVLANGCPNLRRLVVINASELGLLTLAEECLTLQELELHKCNDNVLRGIAACENLQILKLVGTVDGLFSSSVSDVGLTILAQGCKRLVKLELSGCEGSFDGIKAIGQCCLMLEELTICDHRMEDGWLAALSYCENLKTLKLLSCKRIDSYPGPDENLGFCLVLERLYLQRCQLGNKKSVRALFRVCEAVQEVLVVDCWGLDNYMFTFASVCRRVKFLSLEGCSLLATDGLVAVILSWQDLETLIVVSCKNIKESDISPALATLFCNLKELRWRPEAKSLLSSSLVGSGTRKRGGKFFKRT
ncbi:F-box protein [Hibiscus syriacus]|uniref:F-box protein n=1 Tax=Hibiscus syriacus TaxID=106335 RepID=A0A6A2XAF2_HIBSY|nr:F-box protein At5g51380-like [Hibiscus syriacus]KAE8672531.1 F-box protein [Hibiscus syriacus]